VFLPSVFWVFSLFLPKMRKNGVLESKESGSVHKNPFLVDLDPNQSEPETLVKFFAHIFYLKK
jgi:hypothetical protein